MLYRCSRPFSARVEFLETDVANFDEVKLSPKGASCFGTAPKLSPKGAENSRQDEYHILIDLMGNCNPKKRKMRLIKRGGGDFRVG